MYNGINDLLDSLQNGRLARHKDARRLVQALEDLDDQVLDAHAGLADLSLDLSALQSAAASEHDEIRKLATAALARFGHEPSQQHLESLLNDPLASVRQAAADTVAMLQQQQSAPHLAGATRNHGEQPATPETAAEQPPADLHPAEEAPDERRKGAGGPLAAADEPGPNAPHEPRVTGIPEKSPALDLIRQAIEGFDGTAEAAEHGFRLSMQLSDSDRQNLNITAEHDDDLDLDFICIDSNCGPADSGNYRNALVLNNHLLFGALSMEEQPHNRRYFILRGRIPADETSPAGLHRAIRHIAETANQIAKQLRGE